jgi:inner membrane protein
MFIGHLPAGYILTKTLQKDIKTTKYLFVGLVASILPDIDILYFYLIDNRQNLHHSYWMHTPYYWLIIGAITLSAIWLLKKKKYYVAAIIFFANIFLHLILDTIVGKIAWLYPFTAKAFYLFDVPAVYNFWVYNFIFHWTFLFEITLLAWAGYILIKERFLKTSPIPDVN